MIARLMEPWTHDLMATCQEISHEDVVRYRSGGQFRGSGNAEPEPPSAPATALTELPAGPAAVAVSDATNTLLESATNTLGESDKVLESLAWASHLHHLKDRPLLTSIAGALPAAVLEEQVRLYDATCGVVVKPPTKLLVQPHLLRSRVQVATAFNEYLINAGWTVGTRIPRGATTEFAKHLCGRTVPYVRSLPA